MGKVRGNVTEFGVGKGGSPDSKLSLFCIVSNVPIFLSLYQMGYSLFKFFQKRDSHGTFVVILFRARFSVSYRFCLWRREGADCYSGPQVKPLFLGFLGPFSFSTPALTAVSAALGRLF